MSGPGQKRRGDETGALVENGELRGLGGIGEMADQRVEMRPPLCREDRRDGMLVRRIAAESIDGLRRKGDELAGAEPTRGPCDIGSGIGEAEGTHGIAGSSEVGDDIGITSAPSRVAACRDFSPSA